MKLAYLAPGAGLGHLTRALALCLPLRKDAGVDVRIVTDSPFAVGLAGFARCPIIATEDVAAWVREQNPKAIVSDTFSVIGPATCVHLARRLRRPAAIANASLIIELEPLSAEHLTALESSECPRVRLAGPVVLDPTLLPSRKLPRELDHDGLSLVVHSGPEDEVRQLLALDPSAAVISPWFGFEHFPASVLYPRASRILTGAGYNSMAELLAYRHKHTAIAFDRNHDDQAARLQRFFTDPQAKGTQQAVAAILSAIS